MCGGCPPDAAAVGAGSGSGRGSSLEAAGPRWEGGREGSCLEAASPGGAGGTFVGCTFSCQHPPMLPPPPLDPNAALLAQATRLAAPGMPPMTHPCQRWPTTPRGQTCPAPVPPSCSASAQLPSSCAWLRCWHRWPRAGCVGRTRKLPGSRGARRRQVGWCRLPGPWGLTAKITIGSRDVPACLYHSLWLGGCHSKH